MPLAVTEIFYSIQGESTHAGKPCAFVRLSGCNLRCRWCDTSYAWGHGTPMEISEIAAIVLRYQCPLVEITGGEPLLQEETPELCARLRGEGLTVLVETNGSLNMDLLPPGVIRILDVKCPGSGQQDKNDPKNLERLREGDEVKMVLADREDYEFAREILVLNPGLCGRNAVSFSPVFGKLAPGDLARWVLDDRLRVRLALQLHKILFPPDARGV
ncbi:MAG: radical SAM protein [Thermodesulfobacteriota bacterium]